MTCFHVNVRCKFILFITDYVIVESGLLWNMELSNPSACSNDSTCSYLLVSRMRPPLCALIQKPSFPPPPPPPPPPVPSVSYDLMAGRVACARRVFPHEGSSGVVAQAGSVLGQTVRVPVFSQERTAVVLGCLHASITINPNQVQMNR